VMGSGPVCRPIYDRTVTAREWREERAGQTWVLNRIETPLGTLTRDSVMEPTTHSAWIQKPYITGPADYAAAEHFFRHTHFEPAAEPWQRADAEMGEAGIVVGEIMPLPILVLAQSWMGIEGMVEGLYEHRERFDALIEALEAQYLRHVELAAAAPAEAIWFPESLTAQVISPRLFARYCAPLYARAMPVMREAGKIPIAHYDGSIRPLLGQLAQADLPVIEAFNPPPMGDVRVSEAKAAWPGKVVWVNFPGAYFHEPAEVIYDYTLDLLRDGAPGGRLVLGCTEEFPVAEFDKTFSAIGSALDAFEGRTHER
jgi:hypothetical protein